MSRRRISRTASVPSAMPRPQLPVIPLGRRLRALRGRCRDPCRAARSAGHRGRRHRVPVRRPPQLPCQGASVPDVSGAGARGAADRQAPASDPGRLVRQRLHRRPRSATARATSAPASPRISWTPASRRCASPIWQAADIFTSLSDNIQETFGLTPIEAMAAGLPSVVTDWDGYQRHRAAWRARLPRPDPGAAAGAGRRPGRRARHRHRHLRPLLRLCQPVRRRRHQRDRRGLCGPDRQCQPARQVGPSRAQGGAGGCSIGATSSRAIRRCGPSWRRAARSAVESAPANGPLYWPARADPYTLFADYPTEVLSPQHRLEPGDFPARSRGHRGA